MIGQCERTTEIQSPAVGCQRSLIAESAGDIDGDRLTADVGVDRPLVDHRGGRGSAEVIAVADARPILLARTTPDRDPGTDCQRCPVVVDPQAVGEGVVEHYRSAARKRLRPRKTQQGKIPQRGRAVERQAVDDRDLGAVDRREI